MTDGGALRMIRTYIPILLDDLLRRNPGVIADIVCADLGRYIFGGEETPPELMERHG